jgi:type II secretion system protein H
LSGSGGRQSRRRHAAAFTLIELLAVVAILALMATFILPNVGIVRDRALRDQARLLAAQLELARQRAVVTGIPHRLLIDLERGGYRLEWLAGQEEPQPTALPNDAFGYDVDGSTPLPLAAPQITRAEFQPVPGGLGEFRYLESDLSFTGIDTPEGWIERGDTFVAFDGDGTGAYTEIVIDDGAGREIALEILPLADAVRILDAET